LFVPDSADLFMRHQFGGGDVNRVHYETSAQFWAFLFQVIMQSPMLV
jgi:hypothetical protein